MILYVLLSGLKREDGFTADGSGSSNQLASAASASYVPKRKYEIYADPSCHPLAGPLPPGMSHEDVSYEAEPKRLRESNFSPSYMPSSRRGSTGSPHVVVKDPHEASASFVSSIL